MPLMTLADESRCGDPDIQAGSKWANQVGANDYTVHMHRVAGVSLT